MVDALQVQEIDIFFVDAVHGGVPVNWLPFLRQYLAGTAPIPDDAGSSSKEPPPPSLQQQELSNRSAMAWMGWDRRSNALMDAEIASFAKHAGVLTASPTSQ